MHKPMTNRPHSLFWHLFPPAVLIIALAVASIAWYAADAVRSVYIDGLKDRLREQAVLAAEQLPSDDEPWTMDAVDALCNRLGERTNTRFTVVLPGGRVVGDSEHTPESMDNHATRPEIAEALHQGRGDSMRYSTTLRRQMLYLGIRLGGRENPDGVMRTALPLGPIEETLGKLRGGILFVMTGTLLAAAGALLLVARRISRPIHDLRESARELARGNFEIQPPHHPYREMNDLADSVQTLAGDLHSRIRQLAEERNEREAVFTSMNEAVIAVDNEETVLHHNPAAARLLSFKREYVAGASLSAVARNAPLLDLLARSMKEGEFVRADIEGGANHDRVLRAGISPLIGPAGKRLGSVILLTDVTAIRQAEQVRKDFVTNVSHELRTPVTVIQGFAETLREQAEQVPDELRRFCEIIARNAQSLSSIIDDLLALAALENGSNNAGRISMAAVTPANVTRNAIAACEHEGHRKNTQIRSDLDDSVSIQGHERLLELSIANLIQNAIRYSPENKSVFVGVRRHGDEAIISVRDEGSGIPESDLPRIFERFYRVEKARSRAEGGTGLGLAIVKHIAHVHGGRVEAESTLGQGSLFRIILPMSPTEGNSG